MSEPLVVLENVVKRFEECRVLPQFFLRVQESLDVASQFLTSWATMSSQTSWLCPIFHLQSEPCPGFSPPKPRHFRGSLALQMPSDGNDSDRVCVDIVEHVGPADPSQVSLIVG